MQQGVEPRGILASGWITRAVEQGWHRDELAGRKVYGWYAGIKFDFMFDPRGDERLRLDTLRTEIPIEGLWTPRFSGRIVPERVEARLEDLWGDTTGTDRGASGLARLVALEGIRREELAIRYSRDPLLRARKIAEVQQRFGGRLLCEVPRCGFDFEATYGARGAGFAEVHHLEKVSAGKRLNSTRDLLVVCANCHAMLHRPGKPVTFRELVVAARQPRAPRRSAGHVARARR